MNYTMPLQTQSSVTNVPEHLQVRNIARLLMKGKDGDGTPDTVAPDGEKLHNWLLQVLHQAESSIPERKFRATSQEDYEFYAGDQDTPDVLQKLANERRPSQTYNEVRAKIDMLVGVAAQSRREPIIVPVGREDGPLSQAMQTAHKHFRYQLKLSRLEMECFEDTVKGGRSLLHFYIDDENPFSPEMKAVKIDNWNFWVDPDSVMYDMSDAKYLCVDKWIDNEVAFTRWPSQFPNPEGMSRPADMPQFVNEFNNKVRVVECWYRKMEPVVWFINPLTGKPEWARPDEFKAFTKAITDGVVMPSGQTLKMPQGPQGVYGFRRFTYYAIFNGSRILEHGENPYRHNLFPYVLCGGYKDKMNNAWFGAVKTMKDPQRSLNTMRRQLMHLLQTSPRGILMHEAGTLLNPEDYDERCAHPTFRMELAPNSLREGKVQFSKQPTISPIYAQQDSVMSQSMKDSSGIQDSLLGIQTSSREPGVTTKMRQETGIAVLFPLFDNFREFRFNSAKMLMSMIQQFVDQPTLLRIEGPEGVTLIQANTQLDPNAPDFNDITAAQFDLRVDETTESSSVRAATAQLLVEVNHNNPGAIPPEVILDYAGLPFTVQQQIVQYRKQATEAQAAAQQAERDHELALAKIKADADLEKTRLMIEAQENRDVEAQQSGRSAGRKARRERRSEG